MASITLLTLCTLLLWSMAQSGTPTPSTSVVSTTPVEETYTEITPIQFTWNRYTIIATAAAAVVVVAGIAASASLLLPLITYKICYLFGACSYGLDAYVDRYVATDGTTDFADYPVYNAAPGNTGASTTSRRSRRSLEQLGPIITTLAAAYEKYENPQGATGAKKNFVQTAMRTFFTK